MTSWREKEVKNALNLTPILDNVVIMYDQVNTKEWNQFENILDYYEKNTLIDKVEFKIGKRANEYKYKYHVGEYGGGAVTIQWQHNQAKGREKFEGIECYTMRLEFNPEKVKDKKGILPIFDILQVTLGDKPKRVTTMDIAFDIPVDKDSIMIVSLTGKEEDRKKGTRYWGDRGAEGYTKCYDKKKELKDKQGIEISEPFLTRIEYTWKDSDGITLALLEKLNLGLSERLKITIPKDGYIKAEIRAMIYAIQTGYMQLKDFTRSYQQHIKKALDGFQELALDGPFREHASNIAQQLKKYVILD